MPSEDLVLRVQQARLGHARDGTAQPLTVTLPPAPLTDSNEPIGARWVVDPNQSVK